MVALALAVACSVAIGLIFKHAGRQNLDRMMLLTVNYAAAAAVAGGLLLLGGRSVQTGLELSSSLVGLGVVTGALLIGGFFALAWATEVAGMSLAIGVMRLSVVVPFLASWLVWREVPTLAQGAGLCMASVAFLLLAHRPSDLDRASDAGNGAVSFLVRVLPSVDWRATGVLVLTFCLGGAVDVSMKAFEEGFGVQNSRILFLLLAFGVAFVIGAVVVAQRVVRRENWPSGRAVGWGVLLGVINYGSLEFILRAIQALPGPFVFPANNIAVMVLAAVLGVYVWDEALSRGNRIGLGLAVVALVLLGL